MNSSKSRLGVLGWIVLFSVLLAGCHNEQPWLSSGVPGDPVLVGEVIPITVRVVEDDTLDLPDDSYVVIVETPGSEDSVDYASCGGPEGNHINCDLQFTAPGTYTFSLSFIAPSNSFVDPIHTYYGDRTWTVEVIEDGEVGPPPLPPGGDTPVTVTIDDYSWPGKGAGDVLQAGDPITFTVSVNVPDGGPAPTGNITVLEAQGNNTCEIVLPATTCVLQVGAAGGSLVTATYFGDATYSSAVDSVQLLLEHATKVLNVSTSPNPSAPGSAFTVRVEFPWAGPDFKPFWGADVTVAGETAYCGVNTMMDESEQVLLTEDPSNELSYMECQLTLATEGDYTINVDSMGSEKYTSASASVSHTVGNLNNPSTTEIYKTNPPNLNGAFFYTVFYVRVSGEGATPTGTVKVSGAGGSCTVTLDANGEGDCNYMMTQEGQHTITAVYSGDATFASSEGTISYGVLGPTPVPPEPDPVDSDGDGIPDDQDECPNVPGTAEHAGCPPPE